MEKPRKQRRKGRKETRDWHRGRGREGAQQRRRWVFAAGVEGPLSIWKEECAEVVRKGRS